MFFAASVTVTAWIICDMGHKRCLTRRGARENAMHKTHYIDGSLSPRPFRQPRGGPRGGLVEGAETVKHYFFFLREEKTRGWDLLGQRRRERDAFQRFSKIDFGRNLGGSHTDRGGGFLQTPWTVGYEKHPNLAPDDRWR